MHIVTKVTKSNAAPHSFCKHSGDNRVLCDADPRCTVPR